MVLFHVFPSTLRGGFVGVDIFFAISGFLISTIVFRSLGRGDFSFLEFYASRARRIFPGLILVLTATLGFGWMTLLPGEYSQLGKHIAAGAGFVQNFVLWSEAGYFDIASELKPLMHLWSLAIEEQYYLVYPVLIWGAWRLGLNVLILIVAIAAFSFAANVVGVRTDPVRTFFVPETRIWELMAGCALAYVTLYEVPFSTWLRIRTRSRAHRPTPLDGYGRTLRNQAMAAIGLALLVASVLGIDKSKSFPGWWGLAPVGGTFLLIMAGPATWINRLLALKPMVLVGLISYPLYLWHWPVISFLRIVEAELPSQQYRAPAVAASFVLAWLTYRLVEKPLRSRPASSVAPALAGVVGALFLAGMLVKAGAVTGRLDDYGRELALAAKDWQFPGDENIPFEGSIRPGVLFFGDSYVQQLYPRIEHITHAGKPHRPFMFNTLGACVPIPGIERPLGCLKYVTRGFELARSPDIQTVIIGASWMGLTGRGDYYDIDDPAKRPIDFNRRENMKRILDRFEGELQALAALRKEIWLVLIPPGGRIADPSRVGPVRLHGAAPPEDRSAPLSQHLANFGHMNALIRGIGERVGAKIIDPVSWVCANNRCSFAGPDNVPRYKDGTHFRASFIRCCVRDFDPALVPP